MYEALLQSETFYSCLEKEIVLTPVPLSSKRLRSRGYNHAELLANGLGTKFGFEAFSALERIRDTKPQYKLKKEERTENVRGAFVMSHNVKFDIKNKTVILVDDIATTYATLRECTKVLKQNRAKKVFAVVFAKE